MLAYNYFPYTSGKCYLVNSGYPNKIGYLTPYKTTRYHVPDFQYNPPRGREETFNHRHSAGRNSVERGFGCLKMKFRMLQGIPRRPPERQKMIITACMCLHNYIRDSNLRDQHFDMFDGGGYVQEESASYPSAPPEDDGKIGRAHV